MTVEELNQRIKQVLSLGDILKAFIPGEVDDRIFEYAQAVLVDNAPLQQLLIEDVFGGSDGPFMAAGEMTVVAAGEEPKAIDPATLALIIQLATKFGPILLEWIKRRRER